MNYREVLVQMRMRMHLLVLQLMIRLSQGRFILYRNKIPAQFMQERNCV